MITEIIDILTVIAMVVILTIFAIQLMPFYKLAFSTLSASIYGF